MSGRRRFRRWVELVVMDFGVGTVMPVWAGRPVCLAALMNATVRRFNVTHTQSAIQLRPRRFSAGPARPGPGISSPLSQFFFWYDTTCYNVLFSKLAAV